MVVVEISVHGNSHSLIVRKQNFLGSKAGKFSTNGAIAQSL